MDNPNQQAINKLTESMAQWQETLAPIIAACAGIRVKMVEDGWSPVTAEAIAAASLTHFLSKIMT